MTSFKGIKNVYIVQLKWPHCKLKIKCDNMIEKNGEKDKQKENEI